MINRSTANPRNICCIGDTPDDILAGKAAGIVTIGFTGGLKSETLIRSAKPDHVVDSLYKVLDILDA